MPQHTSPSIKTLFVTTPQPCCTGPEYIDPWLLMALLLLVAVSVALLAALLPRAALKPCSCWLSWLSLLLAAA